MSWTRRTCAETPGVQLGPLRKPPCAGLERVCDRVPDHVAAILAISSDRRVEISLHLARIPDLCPAPSGQEPDCDLQRDTPGHRDRFARRKCKLVASGARKTNCRVCASRPLRGCCSPTKAHRYRAATRRTTDRSVVTSSQSVSANCGRVRDALTPAHSQRERERLVVVSDSPTGAQLWRTSNLLTMVSALFAQTSILCYLVPQFHGSVFKGCHVLQVQCLFLSEAVKKSRSFAQNNGHD